MSMVGPMTRTMFRPSTKPLKPCLAGLVYPLSLPLTASNCCGAKVRTRSERSEHAENSSGVSMWTKMTQSRQSAAHFAVVHNLLSPIDMLGWSST